MELPAIDRNARSNMATIAISLSAFYLLTSPAGAVFQKLDSIDAPRIGNISISTQNPDVIAAASDNGLYISYSAGADFRKVAVLKDEQINHLSIVGETVYIAGSRNGYRTGNSTERIFSSREGEELNFITLHNGSLYAGTSDGLYLSNASTINWHRIPGLGNTAVHSMEASGNDIYLACDRGVYSYQPNQTLKRLFVTRSTSDSESLTPYQVKIDTMNPSRLWLCTSKGLYTSPDSGKTWLKFFITGADRFSTYCLSQFRLDGKHVYLCSDAGLLKVNISTGESKVLFAGLSTSKVRWSDITPSGDIFVATDQGLYKQAHNARPIPSVNGDLAAMMNGEPTIQDVQQAAMRYNSVHPDKTENWRKRVTFRALMPRLSVDYDKTIGSSFTKDSHYYAEGPYDWGVSLTWDLDELIWNSYEDDIDNRTKLTTQLRLDILDEINRLYFERLRLKHEISTAESNLEDTTLQQLRLYEITATLDGYTGGLYSQ